MRETGAFVAQWIAQQHRSFAADRQLIATRFPNQSKFIHALISPRKSHSQSI
jgi:hypothetical protein